MSRMIPPFYNENIKSNAEKRIFGLLKNAPDTKDWICLHSLGLARHESQIYGEIDFVVLAPEEGIFCLEVKGGNVGRREGMWAFTNRYGEQTQRQKGPFQQVRDNMFSLIEAVRRHFGDDHRLTRLLYGQGVLFPDISWERDETEGELWQVYDRNFRRSVGTFIQQLSRESRRLLPSKAAPTSTDVQELADFLRGDFELIETGGHRLSSVDEHIKRLTAEQFRCLDGMRRNPRCLFEGGAGTGKTFLALETARRERLNGRRVLLLCFNRLLGAWMSAAAVSKSAEVRTGHFQGILEDMIARSSRHAQYAEAKQWADTPGKRNHFFKTEAPIYALDAVGEGVAEPFDMLIVDEGQDLLTPEFLDVLDALTVGGLAGGRWAFFCDFHRQAIYHDLPTGTGTDAADELRSRLTERAPHFASFELTTNCRNTRPIGEETALLSGFAAPPFLSSHLDGAAVDYGFYMDSEEQRLKIRRIINGLLADGVPPGEIQILSPSQRGNSCLAMPIPDMDCDVRELRDTDLVRAIRPYVTFSTIHAYKGLESAVVILIDVRHIEAEREQALLYVGMSRARQRLFVLLADEARDAFNRAALRKMAQGVQRL